MGASAWADRWDAWPFAGTLPITEVLAGTAVILLAVAGIMIGIAVMTVKRARRRGALPPKRPARAGHEDPARPAENAAVPG